MILQLPYWSRTLRDEWQTLQETLERTTINSTARQVAEAAEKHPLPEVPAALDMDAAPVSVTPRMVEAYRSLIAQQGNRQFYLLIGVDTQGAMKGEKSTRTSCPNSTRIWNAPSCPTVCRSLSAKTRSSCCGGRSLTTKTPYSAQGIDIRLPGE